MDLMKTMLLYMAMALTSAVGDAPMPTPTPTPVPIVTPAPTQEKDPVEEVIAKATKAPAAQKELDEAPAMTPNPKYKLLKKGTRGEAVRKLQQRLKELGYLQAEADGIYGDRTKGAVMRFQKAHGLSRDGIAGKQTQTVLYEYAGVIADPSVATASPVPTEVPTPTLEPTPTPEPVAEPTAEPTQIPVLKADELPLPTGTPIPAVTQILPEETEEPEAEPAEAPVREVVEEPAEESAEAPVEEPAEENVEEPEADMGSGVTTPGLTALAEGIVTVDGMALEAEGLLALSAEMDVLVDVEGLAEALEWDPDPLMEGLGWEIELGENTLVITYSLYEEALDLVSVICNGEDVELTEAMTGLVNGRLFLAPVWLETVGAGAAWDAQNQTLAITFE